MIYRETPKLTLLHKLNSLKPVIIVSQNPLGSPLVAGWASPVTWAELKYIFFINCLPR